MARRARRRPRCIELYRRGRRASSIPCRSELDADVLGVEVLLDAFGAAFAAQAGCLTPPKGAAGLETMPGLRPTMPVSSLSATGGRGSGPG